MGNLGLPELRRLLGWLPEDIRCAVATLTPRQRECVLLLFVMEYTEEEVAAELDIDRSTVTQHKNAAIQKLREMFQ